MPESTPSFDVIVVGAGIVGLALARALLLRRPGARLLVLEKEAAVAVHQTGHNSGVIHSGVYYKPGSLKARLCVEGAAAMLAYCRERGLPHRILGKVIVATRPGELAGLAEIERRAAANGVPGVRRLDAAALRELEPDVAGLAALHVPGVAVTDYAAVARSYAAEIAAAGGEIRTGAEVVAVRRGSQAGEIVLETTQGAFAASFAANCAGLHADRLCRLAGGRLDAAVLPFRGEYRILAPAAAARVRGLIYPVPDPRFPFLGVHFTPRVGGGVEAGPNAVLAGAREAYARGQRNWRDTAAIAGFPGFWALSARYWRKGLNEQIRSRSRSAMARSLRALMPALRDDELLAGGAGVRAQLVTRSGRLVDDFSVLRLDRFLHVLNVPSPAATASLAIAGHLAGQYCA